MGVCLELELDEAESDGIHGASMDGCFAPPDARRTWLIRLRLDLLVMIPGSWRMPLCSSP